LPVNGLNVSAIVYY